MRFINVLLTYLLTYFRLVPTSMTLNVLERRDSPYFAFLSVP